jgi:hypothetical protein
MSNMPSGAPASNVAGQTAATVLRNADPVDPGRLTDHPLANIFPLIAGGEFDALVKDVCGRGLVEPITLYEEQILDGRNRFRACLAGHVKLRFERYEGTDPLGFVISKNLRRRHLSVGQRADLGAQIMHLLEDDAKDRQRAGGGSGPSGRAKLPEPVERPREQAAASVGVSARSIQDAHAIRYGIGTRPPGQPEVIDAVQAGVLPVSVGVKLARQAPEIQREAVAAVQAGSKPSGAMATLRDNAPEPPPDAPYAVKQAAVIRKHEKAIKVLHDAVQRSAQEWSKQDPAGMKVHIDRYDRLLDALAHALEPVTTRASAASVALDRKPKTKAPAKARKPKSPNVQRSAADNGANDGGTTAATVSQGPR